MEGWREAERGFLLQCVCVEEAGSEEQSGGEDAGCSDGDSLCVTLKTLSVFLTGRKRTAAHLCEGKTRSFTHTHTRLPQIIRFIYVVFMGKHFNCRLLG